ncbi:MAG: hypothetical protein ACK4QW_18140 [Alphaproteobacteria bacterium]
MDPQDIEARMSLLLTEMEGEQGDRHEIWQRLKQILDGMRAFGMPLPEDLVRLEDELEREFGPPVAFDPEPDDGEPG